MSIWQAIVLGFIQGLTEFLPVSSSGHLVLAQHFLGFSEPLLSFDIFLHFGTLLAVGVFFFKRLLSLRLPYMIAIIIGTIPAAVVGILFENQIEVLFALPVFVGFEMLVNAVINYLTHRRLQKDLSQAGSAQPASAEPESSERASAKPASGKSLSTVHQTPSIKQSLIVGSLQALSISPGISRSGTTVFGGLWSNLNRTSAFEYSFLLSIPAILGANILHLLDLMESKETIDVLPTVVGAVVAFIVGLLSLELLRYMINKAKFLIFAWYCLILGVLTIFFLR